MMRDYTNLMESMGAANQADGDSGSLTPLGRAVVYGGGTALAAAGLAGYYFLKEPQVASTKPATTPALEQQEAPKVPNVKGGIAEFNR